MMTDQEQNKNRNTTSNAGSLGAYLEVMRIDHWFKNIFVLVGACGYLAYAHPAVSVDYVFRFIVALLLACLVSSINYIINEILDASYDIWHPRKKNRPIPSGRVKVSRLYFVILFLFILVYTVSFTVFSLKFSLVLLLFFLFGLIYNVRPIRAKEIPYVDAIIESANNPIRIAIGWYACGDPALSLPLSAVLFFWVYGAFLMTGKRLAEMRYLGDKALPYRVTFKYYSERSLLYMMAAYAVAGVAFYAYLIFNVFPYHHLTITGLALLILFYAWCLKLTLEEDSIIMDPETLLSKPGFFIFCLIGLIVVITMFLVV